MFHVPERNRITRGEMASDSTYGNNGAFLLSPSPNKQFICIVSDGEGWEHVSVEVFITKGKMYETRCPSWTEMCYIKDTFWDKKDTVMQFHPKESEYVNTHKYVLHLWRKCNENTELPPTYLV